MLYIMTADNKTLAPNDNPNIVYIGDPPRDPPNWWVGDFNPIYYPTYYPIYHSTANCVKYTDEATLSCPHCSEL